MRSPLRAIALGSLLLIFLGACTRPGPRTPTPSPTPRHPQVQGTYISGTSAGDAETLNWILAADSASFTYAGFTLDSLATYDNQFQVQLRHLAKPIEVSPDGLVYTITIRDNLKWSEGKKVTAEDYIYTLKNLMFSDWLNYTYQSDWQETVGDQRVFVEPAVVNETTFTITRQTVDPEFADNALYSLTPYPKHIAQKYERDVKAFTEAPEFNNLTYTGNLGPFKYQEWVRNDKFVVDRNPDFYLGREDGSPYFEQRITKLLVTPAARHAALEAGEITSAGIDPPQVAKFQKMDHLNVYTTPSTGYLLLAYNLRDNGWEGFKNPRVRQALSMSIGKEPLIQQVMLGFGDPAFSFIPRPSPWYTEEGVAKYGVDPLYSKARAKELLLEAGYGTKKPDGSIEVKDKDGKPMKLVIATNSGEKTRESTAFLIKQELSDIGIELELKLVPWPTLLRNYLMNKVPGSPQEPRYNNGPRSVSQDPWDLMVIGLSSNPIAPSGQEVFYTSSGGLNFWGYSSPRVDALFQRVKSREALDPAGRRAIYGEISRVLAEEQPVDFLAFQAGTVGIQKRVQGIEPGINMGWNFHRWFYQ